MFEPTSLKRGEGLLGGICALLGANCGGEAEDGGGGMRRGRTQDQRCHACHMSSNSIHGQ
jgi:hypothetical protein